MEEKLYSPLNFYLRDREGVAQGVYDESQYWRDELSHAEAFEYMEEVQVFLDSDRDIIDGERGLAQYLDGVLKEKVHALFPRVELHGDRLWMVAHLQLNEPLTPLELANLKSDWGGQLSDGWGEGLEQRAIPVDRGELYIEPWTSSNAFFVATQAEFDRRVGIGRAMAVESQPDGELDKAGRDALFTQIAKEHCRIETLERQKLDSLDFHEVSVWGLKAALEAAFEAGQNYQRQDDRGHDAPEPQNATHGGPSLQEVLAERAAQNRTELLEALKARMTDPSLPPQEFVANAEKVSAVDQCGEYLMGKQNFTADHLAFLVTLENPVEVLADRMLRSEDDFADLSSLTWDIYEERDYLEVMPLVTDLPESEPPAEPPKRSLLGDVRRAQERIAENDRHGEARDAALDTPGPEL